MAYLILCFSAKFEQLQFDFYLFCFNDWDFREFLRTISHITSSGNNAIDFSHTDEKRDLTTEFLRKNKTIFDANF